MTRRALLIGSATGGLAGVQNDVALMKETLSGFGFDMDVRLGDSATHGSATRDSILEGYRALIHACGPDDAAVVYYSGHGARADNPDYGKPGGGPHHYRCIVPTDFLRSTESDFRGITDLELSGLLAELTEKTRNVTVMLDCCHASLLCRKLEVHPRPRFLDKSVGSIGAHLRRLREAGIVTGSSFLMGNPFAVRLVGCGQLQSSWEYQAAQKKVVGVLTESLAEALRDAGSSAVTWKTVGMRVRHRVLGIFPSQRPEVEGPQDRLLFSTEERPNDGALEVISSPGDDAAGDEPAISRVRLHGGRLLDVRPADEYELIDTSGANTPIGRAVVVRVWATSCEATLAPPRETLPPGTQARLVRRAAGRAPIQVDAGDDALGAALKAAVERCPLTAVAAPGDETSVRTAGERPIASLAVRDGNLEIRDHAGDLLAWPRPVAEALETLEDNLRSIGSAHAMRKLSSTATGFDESTFSVTWGRVRNGREMPLPLIGGRVKSGERVSLSLSNDAARTLYFNVFDIGVSQSVTLLSIESPSGIPVRPGARHVIGEGALGALVGWPAKWPKSVPVERERHLADPAREERVVVVVTDEPCELRPAETPGVRAASLLRELTGTEKELALALDGTYRDAVTRAQRGKQASGYRIVHIEFFLEPPPV